VPTLVLLTMVVFWRVSPVDLMSLRPSNLFWSIVVNNIFKGIRWRKLTILMVIFVLSFVTLMATVFFYQWSSDYTISANKKLSSIESRIKTATKNSNVLYSNMKTLEAFYESLSVVREVFLKLITAK